MRRVRKLPARRPLDIPMALLLVLFLVYGCFAVVHMGEKTALPAAPGGTAGDEAWTSIDGIPVANPDEAEFILSGCRIGDTVLAAAGSAAPAAPVVLVPYYSPWYIVLDILVALVIIGLGIVVALYHEDRSVATVFLAASVALGVSLLGTKTIYATGPAWLGAALCSTFFLAYAMIPVLFLHFTSMFPVRRFHGSRGAARLLYGIALAVAAWQAAAYLDAGWDRSIDLFRRSLTASIGMNGLMVAGIVTGLVVLVGTYRGAVEVAERKKAAWVLYGIGAGTLPFVLFWAMPQALGSPPVIPEWIFKACLLAIPASFTIAILRYRLVDITTLIGRSAVHAIVIGALLIVYTLLIAATAGFVSRMTVGRSILLSAVAAVLAVVAYDTLRGWARRLVDRSLFRLSYDFRGSLKELLEGLKVTQGVSEMAAKLTDGVGKLIPVERIGVFTLEQPGNRLRAASARNFPGLDSHGVRFEIERLKSGLDLPVAVNGHIEKSAGHEEADAAVFGRWGISLAVPMKSKQGAILGFLVLGRKTSGLKYTADDVDLLTVLAGHAAAEHERITLSRSLVIERAESERLEELNRLKSYFVSSVSHDLKTPLTSIRMFAELLRTQRGLPADTTADYLKIIEGEADRLTRLINNVLDFAKIERGVKEYQKRETDLNDIVARMMALMHYQFAIERCETTVTPAEGPLAFEADPDAVLEALLNLVGNSLKYTGEPKRIRIATSAGPGTVGVSVGDNGIGIDPSEVGEIFKPFHRGAGGLAAPRGGAGLGLSVVRHVVDAHGGEVRVESEPGKGSTFTMTFPVCHSTTPGGTP
jgi:signal transduction histidine kinase